MSYGELHSTEKTTPSIQEFVKQSVIAWKKLFDEIPTKEQIGILYAKYALETGRGKNCFGNNIGNIKKFPNDSHKDGYQQLRGVWEIIGGKIVVFPPEHPQSYFRWYPTLEAGIIDYMKLVSNGRYKKAWEALLTGNPQLYAQKLKDCGYYTADVNEYVSGVKSIFNEVMRLDIYETVVSTIEAEKENYTPIEWSKEPYEVPNALDFVNELAEEDNS